MLKYVNKNNFPVVIPDQRGGQIVLNSGQGAFNQWFSRFVGKGMLTAINVDDQSAEVVKVQQAQAAQSPLRTQVAAVIKDEVNENWTRIKGIYRCVRCDIYRTGSRTTMEAHISDFHGMGSKKDMVRTLTQGLPIERDKETMVVSSTPQPVVPEIPTEPIEPVAEPSTIPAQEITGVPCPVPGCGKSFNSARGLAMHTSRAHPA